MLIRKREAAAKPRLAQSLAAGLAAETIDRRTFLKRSGVAVTATAGLAERRDSSSWTKGANLRLKPA